MDCHAAHALLAQQAQTSHWLISPKNSIREWNNRWFPQQTIMQQDSNTTQATDRTKRDALSFGAKQIAIMTEVELIAGSLHCLC